MCWLIRHKARVPIPGKVSKRNMKKKNFFGEASKICDKCYDDKPETIDAIKDNIRETIGKIQLHTIDNVLKNWTHRVGYCMAS